MKYADLIKVANSLKELSEVISNNNNVEDHPVLSSIDDNKLLDSVTFALVSANYLLKDAICEAEKMVESSVSEIDREDLDAIAALATEFDNSDDEFLQKQASVLDQVLLNFAGQKKVYEQKKAAEAEVDRLREGYRAQTQKDLYIKPTETLDKDIKASESAEKIKNQVRNYRPLEAPLSTRHCPDHPGTSVIRVGENIYQCALDKKIYNYQEGYTTMKGNKIPGTDVSEQTRSLSDRVQENMNFSTRESRLND